MHFTACICLRFWETEVQLLPLFIFRPIKSRDSTLLRQAYRLYCLSVLFMFWRISSRNSAPLGLAYRRCCLVGVFWFDMGQVLAVFLFGFGLPFIISGLFRLAGAQLAGSCQSSAFCFLAVHIFHPSWWVLFHPWIVPSPYCGFPGAAGSSTFGLFIRRCTWQRHDWIFSWRCVLLFFFAPRLF